MAAVGGLGQQQSGVLGAEQEAVEEARRQDDVVVDDQQPVVARRGVLGEQRSRCSNLPPSPIVTVCMCTSWRVR